MDIPERVRGRDLSNQILEKYDVAISYLSRDEDLARAIYTELAGIFNIFIYTQHQKKLAGGDGIELLREIFIEKSTLIVILYRDGWGKTGWTSTEEKAIQEFGLNNRWEGILLVNLDGNENPKWFPGTLFSLDFQKYKFEELIGAIKVQAQERGSKINPVTAVEKARILQINRELTDKKKRFLNSEEGVNEALSEVKCLFDEIERICTEINTSSVNFKHEKRTPDFYYLKGYNPDNRDSPELEIQVHWSYKYRNSLNESKLFVTTVRYLRTSKMIDDLLYDFDITPLMENQWRDNQNNKPLTSSELADEIVKILIGHMSS